MTPVGETVRVDNEELLKILYPLIKEDDLKRDQSIEKSFGLVHLAGGSQGGKKCLEFLLREGRNIEEICNKFDLATPLHFAVIGNRTENVKYLLRMGANPNARDGVI